MGRYLKWRPRLLGLKMLLLMMAGASGSIRLSRALHRRYVRILAYHGVDWLQDPIINWDGLQVRPRVFRSHLDLLRQHYNVLPLSEVVGAMIEGRDPGINTVAITFDDGYRNNVALAAPLLAEYGFPATFYVSSGFVDGTAVPWWYELRAAVACTRKKVVELPNGSAASMDTVESRMTAVMTWERFLRTQTAINRLRYMEEVRMMCSLDRVDMPYPLMGRDEIRRLIDMGFEVAPHTVSHISMSHENKEVIESEIRSSILAITEITGQPITTYSYPHGSLPQDYDSILQMMKQNGVRAAVTTMEGMNRLDADLFKLRRLNVSGHRRDAFAALLSGLTGLLHND